MWRFSSAGRSEHRMAGSRTPGPICFTTADPNDSGTLCLAQSPVPRPVANHGIGSIPPSAEHNTDWKSFLDSYGDWNVGQMIAFESEAHREKTQEAWDAVRNPLVDALPPGSETRYRLQLVGDRLPADVVNADITIDQFSDSANSPVTDIKSFAGDLANRLFVIPKEGQAEHFQAFQYQKQLDAFRWGLKEIAVNTDKAIAKFRDWPRSSKLREYELFDGDGSSSRDGARAAGIANALAHGIHPLQDSFSPAHVVREWDGDILKIRKITVWREQTEDEHKAGDKDWHDKQKDGHPSWGDAAKDATELLLNYFIWAVLGKQDTALKARSKLLLTYFIFEPKS